jgi:hypothetical protein
MKRLLQQRRTRKFLREDGSWTINSNEAYSLQSLFEAGRFCHDLDLHGIDIILKVTEDPQYDVRIALQ